jgi:hypothetical protein
MLRATGFRLQVSGLAGLALVLMLAFSGCAGEQALDARGEKGYATADQASAAGATEATRGTEVQASTSAGAIGEAEQYRDNCRMQIYIFKEDMNKAEVKDFTARVTYRVQANLNGGDDKNLDELLDDIDVPAYRDLCG